MIAVEVGRSDRGLLVIGVGVGDVVVSVNLDVAVDVNTLMSMRKYVGGSSSSSASHNSKL